LELMADGTPDLVAEAIDLTRQSAGQAARRLQFYRIAYGEASGLDQGRGLAVARELALGLLADGKITLDWPEDAAGAAPALGRAVVRLILNMIALARESLPRGGALAVRIAGAPEGSHVEVTARGAGAGFKDAMRASLAGTVDLGAIGPDTVQGYFTRRLAAAAGGILDLDEAKPDSVRLSATLRSTV